MAKVALLGAGGHGKVVLEALLTAGEHEVVAVLDADSARWGKELLGVPIIGGDDQIAALRRQGVSEFCIGVGGNKNNGPRRAIYERLVAQGLTPLTVIHPRAYCSQWCEIGPGCFVACGARLMAGARLGANCILNTGSSLDHDCAIGDHVHIGPGATLCGNVRVGALSHIGAQAVVRQDIQIGPRVIVGAGAVVVKDVPEGLAVVGCPAAPLAAAFTASHPAGPQG